ACFIAAYRTYAANIKILEEREIPLSVAVGVTQLTIQHKRDIISKRSEPRMLVFYLVIFQIQPRNPNFRADPLKNAAIREQDVVTRIMLPTQVEHQALIDAPPVRKRIAAV